MLRKSSGGPALTDSGFSYSFSGKISKSQPPQLRSGTFVYYTRWTLMIKFNVTYADPSAVEVGRG